MDTQIDICVLTGYSLQTRDAKVYSVEGEQITYEFPAVGKVKIALSTYMAFKNQRALHQPELAGICREAWEDGREPPLINDAFLATEVKEMDTPKTFRAKAMQLVKHMYKKGGKDLKAFEFMSTRDYPLAYADGPNEFIKVIDHLQREGLIWVGVPLEISAGRMRYEDVLLTEGGIAEAEKVLPVMPLIGLVMQDVSTGEEDADTNIILARRLFFEEPTSMEKMRLACERLSFVLEPLREECNSLFGKPETSAFFRIVNDFNIRHNKAATKEIEHPEQLEWVYYSLLNTITTYSKLKRRLGSTP